ncbi:putative tetratricopeptide-like helical domain superfamily [Arabidopsis thaliana]
MRGSYSNIIARFCERGMASEAEALLNEMSSADIATFRAMIDGYVRAGRVDDAVRIFNKMVAASLRKLAIHHAYWLLNLILHLALRSFFVSTRIILCNTTD